MPLIFQKNLRAIRRGNHMSTVDAEYCTKCSVDLAGPLFDNTCHDTEDDCPHMRKVDDQSGSGLWCMGDRVTTRDGDGSMGAGNIVAFFVHGDMLAIVHYPKYDTEPVPCYRAHWVADLRPWIEPDKPARAETLRRKFLNDVDKLLDSLLDDLASK